MWGSWRWLGQGWFLTAVAVLLANDRWLKAAFPGWWTGKLSDVVGPVVVAALLGVLIGRAPAVVLTAIGFVALKTAPGVAELAAPALGGVTLRDPTDLIGLLALPPAWWLMGRSAGAHRRLTTPHQPSPSAAALRHTGRRAASVAGATIAVLAITATSYDDPPYVAELTVDADGRPVARVEDHLDEHEDWMVSDDGGMTWTEMRHTPREAARDHPSEACRTDGWCFRATGDAVEERPPGGEWRRSFWFSKDQEGLIDYRRYGYGPSADERFAHVVVVSGPAGEHVVASAADEGVVVLDPRGEWQRRAVLNAEPTDLNSAMWPMILAQTAYVIGVGPVAFVGILVEGAKGRGPRGEPTGCGPGILAVIIGLVFWTMGAVIWLWLNFNRLDPLLIAAVLTVFGALTVFAPRSYLREVRRTSAT